jgi:hypothetical protein
MTRIFLGGSRRISRLPKEVQARLDRMIEQQFLLLIGDANGADKAFQRYLAEHHYAQVEIFCAGTTCRNNEGSWPLRQVTVSKGVRGFELYAFKDRVMAQEADFSLMLWDGESRGTLANAARLVRLNKKVVIYEAPEQRFIEIRSEADWQQLLARCPLELRQQVEAEGERMRVGQSEQQASLFA